MKVTLNRVNEQFHFEATGLANVPVHIDGSPDIGGENAGARPMELLLMGLGGCAAIDIVLILKKQKQVITDFIVTVEGDRDKCLVPAPFKTIHLIFHLKGMLDEAKVKRAVDLSVEKYCSVHVMLSQVCKITHEYRINSLFR